MTYGNCSLLFYFKFCWKKIWRNNKMYCYSYKGKFRYTVKILKFRTPENFTVINLKVDQYGFSLE